MCSSDLARVNVDRGDSTRLQAGWGDLQRSLKAQGIELRPIEKHDAIPFTAGIGGLPAAPDAAVRQPNSPSSDMPVREGSSRTSETSSASALDASTRLAGTASSDAFLQQDSHDRHSGRRDHRENGSPNNSGENFNSSSNQRREDRFQQAMKIGRAHV